MSGRGRATGRVPAPRAPRTDGDEGGFTLLELMVVVLVVAVLVAVGLPSYLGAREQANERAVQANVRNAFTATRIYYNERLAYTDDPVAMTAVEPSLRWTTGALDATSPPAAVSVTVFDDGGTAQTVIVGGRTATGRCFYLRDVMGGLDAGTYYDAQVSAGATCPQPAPAGVTADAWSR